MRFVPIKTPEQLDLQALHRVRDRLIARRTSVSNQLRGLLLERGIPVRAGRGGFRQVVPELLAADDDRLSPALRHLVDVLWAEWCTTDRAVEALTKGIEGIAARDEACRRLPSVPGVGPLVATAMVAAIADGSAFRRAAASPPGSAWCPSGARPGARRGSGASPGGATATCAGS